MFEKSDYCQSICQPFVSLLLSFYFVFKNKVITHFFYCYFTTMNDKQNLCKRIINSDEYERNDPNNELWWQNTFKKLEDEFQVVS